MSTMPERLQEIRAREAKATKGPWKAVQAGAPVNWEVDSHTGQSNGVSGAVDDSIVTADNFEVLGSSEWINVKWDDLEFMAHAREDIPSLLARISELESGLEK